jgi:hypothetical protein
MPWKPSASIPLLPVPVAVPDPVLPVAPIPSIIPLFFHFFISSFPFLQQSLTQIETPIWNIFK